MEAIFEQLRVNPRLRHYAESAYHLRKKVCASVFDAISTGRIIWPFGDQDPVEWKENMEKQGTFADEVFVMLTAISINRDIVSQNSGLGGGRAKSCFGSSIPDPQTVPRALRGGQGILYLTHAL